MECWPYYLTLALLFNIGLTIERRPFFECWPYYWTLALLLKAVPFNFLIDTYRWLGLLGWPWLAWLASPRIGHTRLACTTQNFLTSVLLDERIRSQ